MDWGRWKLAGTSDCLGLGMPGIMRAFEGGFAALGAFAWKLAFAVVALGAALGMAAAHPPLALSLRVVEPVGTSVLPHVAIVTTVAYLLTGLRRSALLGGSWAGRCLDRVVALRDLREAPREEPEAPRQRGVSGRQRLR